MPAIGRGFIWSLPRCRSKGERPLSRLEADIQGRKRNPAFVAFRAGILPATSMLVSCPESGQVESSDECSAMKQYYAARASEYDRVYAKPERQQDLRAIEQWLPGVLRNREVLEVACGTGYWTQFLAPAARQVLAIDASVEVLRIARSRVEEKPVRFAVGDAYQLPVHSRSYDGAFAGFWFSHVPIALVGEFLHGLHQALVPGAKVVLLDNRFVEASSTAISEQDADGNTYQLRRLEDGSTHRVLKNFPSARELHQAVQAVASEVRHHEWQHFWALEYSVARS